MKEELKERAVNRASAYEIPYGDHLLLLELVHEIRRLESRIRVLEAKK